MPSGLRKSTYIFLACILGVILFLILHRLAVFLYILLLDSSYSIFSLGMNYMELVALDYFTLLISLMLGGWYGIWVGLYWYDVVYEHGKAGGLVNHIARGMWLGPQSKYDLKSRVATVADRFESDLQELESLTVMSAAPVLEPQPLKKRIVRKKPPVVKM